MAELVVTQVKSSIGRLPKHRKVLRSLGLRKIGASRQHKDTPVIQGMIKKVSYLIKVEKVES